VTDKNSYLTIPEDRIIQARLIFEDFINGMNRKTLAEKYNVSERTITYRLDLAREDVHKSLKETGQKLAADFYSKYENGERDIWQQWLLTRDPNVYSNWLKTIKEMRMLLGVDEPPKAPVNQKGQVVPDKVIIFNFGKDAQNKYDELEKKVEKLSKKTNDKVIDGTWEESTIDQSKENE